MVQLGLTLNEKQKEVKDGIPEKEEIKETKEPEKLDNKMAQEEVNFDDILASVGLDPYVDDEPKYVPPTMHWAYIRRIATAQSILATFAAGFVIWAMFCAGLNWEKVINLSMVLFILFAGLIGRRGARKRNYCLILLYFVLLVVQTAIHVASFAWTILALYRFEKLTEYMPLVELRREEPVMYLNLAESVAIAGTMFTGLCGLFACCRGFARLMKAQDKAIYARLEEKKVEEKKEEAKADEVLEEEEEELDDVVVE